MPKVLVKKLQAHKSHINLEPSKAWIRNMGIGTTKVMPKQKWIHKQPVIMTVNKTKFKSTKMINRRLKHLPNLLYDSMNARNGRQKASDKLPTLTSVLDNYFDDTVSNFPNECDINDVNPVNKGVQLSTPVHKRFTDSATFDFSQQLSSSSNLYDNKLNDTPPSLPFSSTELSTNSFAQMDEAPFELYHMDMIKLEVEPNCDFNMGDAYLPFEVSSYAQSNGDKHNDNDCTNQLSDMYWSVLTQAQSSNQMSQAPLFSTEAFIHPVYMCDDDVRRLIESGHIVLIEERLYYKHKDTI